MLSLPFVQPGAPSLTNILPTLGVWSWPELTWWNQTQLYEMSDQAVKHLARTAGVFVDRDTTMVISGGVGTYSLPAEHVSTLHLSFNGVALKPAGIQDLEALDAGWVDTTAASPTFFTHINGLESIAVYPAPNGTIPGPLPIILQRFPPALSASNTELGTWGPIVAMDYVCWYVLGEALTAETKGAMPEVGQWFQQLCQLFEQAATSYWGVSD